MNKRFLLFISLVLLILSLAGFYMGVKVISWSPWFRAHPTTVWLSLAGMIAIQLAGPYLYRARPHAVRRWAWFHWITYMALGVFVSLFLYTLFIDGATLWMDGSPDSNEFRLVGLAVFSSVTVLIGWVQVARGPKVYDVSIPIQKLPQAFVGFRIVQISDLHIGPTIGKDYAREVVDKANALDPDIVVLTGDFIDGTVGQLEKDLEPLAELKAKSGIFFVTGNHEYYWNVEEWVPVFQRLGAQVLLNEHVRLKRDGSEIILAGVTDLTAGRILPSHASNPQKALSGAPEGLVKILLAHNPDTYKATRHLGYDLQLSGHTHGGQFFPWSLIVKLVHPYCKGLYKSAAGGWIYVNRGTGYWGPPLRFAVPTEISLIRLMRA